MISTPFVPVPPPRYGGTELVVHELVNGLVARGHEVTLFATGDSRTPAELRALVLRAQWPPEATLELDHAAWAIGEIAADPRGWDVIHAHLPAALSLARFAGAPMIYTVHHDRDERLVRRYGRSGARLVTISGRQRELLPEAEEAAVIHHGLTPSSYPLGRGDGGFLAFLGRIAPEKGAHLAIDVARETGIPLELAGRPHWCDQRYYAEEILPRAARSPVQLVGEVGGVAKTRFLGAALALLFPAMWEEPFGLVMIESMLCGTPVVGLPRGSVPEVIDEGVTGFVCADADEMARRVRQIAAGEFDRRRCRARAVERFSAGRMVDEYLALYRQCQQDAEAPDARSAATP